MSAVAPVSSPLPSDGRVIPDDLELSILMPVYNEAEALPSVLEEAAGALAQARYRYEIILVDDASTDRSLEILEQFRRRHPDVVRVLRHESNRGIAGAFETLYAAARGRFVLINGSDGQVKTADCLRLLDLRERYDLVVGKRRKKCYTLWRSIISAAFNLLPIVLFGVRTHDAGCVKLFRAELLQVPLVSRGPFREAERIIRAHRRGYRIGHLRVEHQDRRGGRSTGARWPLLWLSLGDLWRCWWSIVAGGER